MTIQQIMRVATNNNISFLKQFPILQDPKIMKIINCSLFLLIGAVPIVIALIVYKIQRARIPLAHSNQNPPDDPLIANRDQDEKPVEIVLEPVKEINYEDLAERRRFDIKLLFHFTEDILCVKDYPDPNELSNRNFPLNSEEMKKALSECDNDQYLDLISKSWGGILDSIGIFLHINNNKKKIIDGQLHELYFQELKEFTQTKSPRIYQMALKIARSHIPDEIRRIQTNVLKFIGWNEDIIDIESIDKLYLDKLKEQYGICERLPEDQRWRLKGVNRARKNRLY